MSEGEDFTFMRSGFNNLVEQDETFENTAAVIMVFMENAVKTASMYVSHTHRTEITPEDIKRALMLELFLMGSRDDNLEKCLAMKQNVKEWMNNDTDDEESDEDNEEHDEEEFEESECTCAICNVMNSVYERWEGFQPSTKIEEVIYTHLTHM